MNEDEIQIKDLDSAIPTDNDYVIFQSAVGLNEVYKTTKSELNGDNAYVYIGYASDNIGTSFTLTFNPLLNYIAILATTTEIPTPIVGDFAGLWKNYKGAPGDLTKAIADTLYAPVLTSDENYVTDAELTAIGTISSKASLTGTETLTNKRITQRVTTITSNATPTINTDSCDAVTITAQAEAITSMTTNLSGTPTNFQKLIIRIKDNGTARAITWGTSFEAKGVALPVTTVISKVLTVGFIYDTVTSKWGCVASSQES